MAFCHTARRASIARRHFLHSRVYLKPGYYPTNYTIRYNASRQTYVIALGGFVLPS